MFTHFLAIAIHFSDSRNLTKKRAQNGDGTDSFQNKTIWILSNRKGGHRKGKMQLIDAFKMKSPLPRNVDKKNCEFTSEIRKKIVRIFFSMEESEVSGNVSINEKKR